MGPIGKQFLELLKMASAISFDDGPPLNSWETSPLTGSPDNEILSASWNDGGTTYSLKLTEQGVSNGALFADGRFIADDNEGESMLIRLYALRVLTPVDLLKAKETPQSAPTSPKVLFHTTNSKHLASLLEAAGIPVASVSEPDDEADGEISITPAVHVQVGFGDCCVVVKHPEGQYRFMRSVDSMDALLTDIREGIKEAEAAAPKTATRPKG